MKKTVIYLFSAALLSLVPVAAGAQSGNEALPFVRITHDPVTSATGGAGLVSTSSMAYSSFSNAAAIPYCADFFDAGVSYQMWQPTSSSFINAGLAFNFGGKVGLAAGASYGMNKSYDIFDDNGNAAGQFTPSDIQANLGLSWKFLPFLSLGANVKYLGSTLAKNHSYNAVSSDIFFMTQLAGFKAALGLSSLGSKVKSVSGASYSLPTSAALGLGYDAVFSEKHEVNILLDADYYFSGASSVAVGAAYTFNDLLSVRAGYRYGGKSVIPSYASAGLGIRLWGVKLDAAYLIASGNSPMKNTMNFGLGFAF